VVVGARARDEDGRHTEPMCAPTPVVSSGAHKFTSDGRKTPGRQSESDWHEHALIECRSHNDYDPTLRSV